MTSPSPPSAGGPEPLLTQRSLLILLAGCFVGLVFGCLTFLSTGNVPEAVVAGLTAAGASVLGLQSVVP